MKSEVKVCCIVGHTYVVLHWWCDNSGSDRSRALSECGRYGGGKCASGTCKRIRPPCRPCFRATSTLVRWTAWSVHPSIICEPSGHWIPPPFPGLSWKGIPPITELYFLYYSLYLQKVPIFLSCDQFTESFLAYAGSSGKIRQDQCFRNDLAWSFLVILNQKWQFLIVERCMFL